MRPSGFLSLCTAVILAAAAPPASAQPSTPLGSPKALESYALGQEVAESIKRLDADLDIDALLQGLRDSLENKASQVNSQELMKAQGRAHSSLLRNREERLSRLRKKHGQAGQEFRMKMKRDREIITTPSGLQYQILKKYDGPKPTPTSRVKFHYRASFIDGTEFDSSLARGEPAVLGVAQSIPGWTEAFQLMSPGSKFRLILPPELAYGPQGLPGKVPPDATLIYEISLLEILP